MIFDEAFKDVMRWEGGYVNNPNDPGGATNFGVSLRFLKKIDENATEDTIKALTKEQAKQIYYTHFWKPYSYEELPYIIAIKLFSIAVNVGQKNAVTILQRALRACEHKVEEDGIIGNKTIVAVRTTDPYKLRDVLKSEQAAYYRVLVVKNPSLGGFLKGWLNRAYS